MQDFLREFHMRRREEAMAVERGPQGWWKRFTAWIGEAGAAKWAYGAGLGYAAIAAMFLMAERPTQVEHSTESVRWQVVPAAPDASVEQLEELDLRPESQGATGDQEF